MNLLLIMILWIASIIASYAFCATPIIALIKEAGENGYKLDYDEIDKFTDIIDLGDEEKIQNLLLMMPVINIIYSLKTAAELIQKKALLITSLNTMNAFKKMTHEEALEYSKSKSFLILIKSDRIDQENDLKALKFSLKFWGFINYKKDCDAYYCINNKLEHTDIKYKLIYKNDKLNITEEKSIKIADLVTSSNEDIIKLNIGYLIKNPKIYNSKNKKNINKLYAGIESMRYNISSFNEENISCTKENNIFPSIKENIISISMDNNRDKLVLADKFFEEIENNGYTSNIKFTNFNDLTYKLLLSKTLGLDIELVKNKNLLLNNNDNVKKLTK